MTQELKEKEIEAIVVEDATNAAKRSKEELNTPKLESKTRVSKDGKWLVQTTTITSFTSMNYVETVMKSKKA